MTNAPFGLVHTCTVGVCMRPSVASSYEQVPAQKVLRIQLQVHGNSRTPQDAKVLITLRNRHNGRLLVVRPQAGWSAIFEAKRSNGKPIKLARGGPKDLPNYVPGSFEPLQRGGILRCSWRWADQLRVPSQRELKGLRIRVRYFVDPAEPSIGETARSQHAPVAVGSAYSVWVAIAD